MQNFPIFTFTGSAAQSPSRLVDPVTFFIALTFVLGALGYRGAVAWQDTPATAEQPAESAPKQDTVQPNPNAAKVIQQSRHRLFDYDTIQAGITQKVSLGQYQFQSTGSFASAKDFRFRLEYTVELGNMEGRFLEVCDGQILHTRRSIGKKNVAGPAGAIQTSPDMILTRRDIQKILKETRQNLDKPEVVQAAEIGIGGLPAVMASLERSLVFDAMQEETLDGQDVYVVEGQWKQDRREKLLAGLGSITNQVAGFVPDRVRVYINKQTMFPVRFAYLKKVSPESETFQAILIVNLSDVRLNQPVAPQSFAYSAPIGMEEVDETAMYLEYLKAESN